MMFAHPIQDSGLQLAGISSPIASAFAAFFAFLLLIVAIIKASTKNAHGASTKIVIGVYAASTSPIAFPAPDVF